MDVADATGPVVENEGVTLSDVDSESTPKSKRESSPAFPPVRHVHRGHGFVPVCKDMVEVYLIRGERMQFDTKDITTGDLRYGVTLSRGVPVSQVRLLCGQSEVGDGTLVMVGQLSVAFRCPP